ncbi:MAG TPA: hypothetical protein VJ259_08185, partial [Actinomycetota bacterium]|nr:hypothetical protein [Actinomycetota bacterium]
QTPAARSFTVATDTVAPATTIVAGPTGTVPLNSASFTWTGSDDRTPAGSLVYAFRLHPLEPTFSAFGRATRRSYAGLPNGRTYTFYVKARDLAGREDQTPAARRFTVSVPTTTVRAGTDR